MADLNLAEIYVANPRTSLNTTDLLYLSVSGTTDGAIQAQNLFNTTNLQLSAGKINTIQDITTTSDVQFRQIVAGNQTTGGYKIVRSTGGNAQVLILDNSSPNNLYISSTDITGDVYFQNGNATFNHGGLLSNGNWVFGAITSAGAKVNVLATSEQLRLSYDATTYSSFETAAAGHLEISCVADEIRTDSSVVIGSLSDDSQFAALSVFSTKSFGINVLGQQVSDTNGNGTGATCGITTESFLRPAMGASLGAGVLSNPNFGLAGGQTIDVGASFYASPSWDLNSGTVTLYAGLYVECGGALAGGVVTDAYGLYVENPAVGTNKYGAYIAGNVGIGTTAPPALLSIANGGDDPTNYGKALQITNANGNSQQIAFIRFGNNVVSCGYEGASAIWGFGTGTATDASFSPTFLAIDANNQRIGIGTTSPQAKLEISVQSAVLYGTRITGTQQGDDTGNSIALLIDATVQPTANGIRPVGMWVTPTLTVSSTNTAPQAYGLYLDPTFNVGSGAITDAVSLFVGVPGAGTNRYSAVFEGAVGIGTASPGDIFDVQNDSQRS